jgi:hypothetical protein
VISESEREKLQRKSRWLEDSMILKDTSEMESLSLIQMTKAKKGKLIYRATEDGFSARDFHSKCDYVENTLIIIKTDSNYIFGGFTTAKWNRDDDTSLDKRSFIFSLRRDNVFESHMLKVKDPKNSITRDPKNGPIFGCEIKYDLFIKDCSNKNLGSYCDIGRSYQCPDGFESYDHEMMNFLTGSYSSWLTKEIEVYQLD